MNGHAVGEPFWIGAQTNQLVAADEPHVVVFHSDPEDSPKAKPASEAPKPKPGAVRADKRVRFQLFSRQW